MSDLAIRLQKAAAAHCEGLDLPHDLGLVLAEVVESAGVAAWPKEDRDAMARGAQPRPNR